MSRDSQISHVHFKKSHHSLYISTWFHDKLEPEEIDPTILPFDLSDEDLDSATNISQSLSFASVQGKKKSCPPAWKDLDLRRFLQEEAPKNRTALHGRDLTMLKKLDFPDESTQRPLNGATTAPGAPADVSSSTSSPPLPSPRLYPNTETSGFESSNNNLNNNTAFTTPEVIRKRPAQRNFSGGNANFQTPVGRIMR